jgi:hypothetical protein
MNSIFHGRQKLESAMTPKQLLLKQTAEAFSGRPDMPLRAALEGITDQEASWRIDDATPTIEQLVRHIAWAKSSYCAQGFGTPMVIDDATVNAEGDSPDLPIEFPCGSGWGRSQAPGIAGAIGLLERAHRVIVGCLESCTEAALDQPIPTNHGKSAAHFFWMMLMHDLYHAGQIRTRRTMFRVRLVNTESDGIA